MMSEDDRHSNTIQQSEQPTEQRHETKAHERGDHVGCETAIGIAGCREDHSGQDPCSNADTRGPNGSEAV
jgi:hypothetical protein